MRIRKRPLDGLGDQPAFKTRSLSQQVSSVVSGEEAATEPEAKLKEAEAKVVSLERALGIAMLDADSLEKEKEKFRLTEAQVGILERELNSLADSHAAEREALQTQAVELESSLAVTEANWRESEEKLNVAEAKVVSLERELGIAMLAADSLVKEKEKLRLTEAQVGILKLELNSLADSHAAERECLQTQVVDLESSLAATEANWRESEEKLNVAEAKDHVAELKKSAWISKNVQARLEKMVVVLEEKSKIQRALIKLYERF